MMRDALLGTGVSVTTFQPLAEETGAQPPVAVLRTRGGANPHRNSQSKVRRPSAVVTRQALPAAYPLPTADGKAQEFVQTLERARSALQLRMDTVVQPRP